MTAETSIPSIRLYRFSVFLVCWTALLILAGGLVTSHGAGLAVPDWPLSYGKFFPPMVGNIFWEHGHRMIAGSVAVMTVVLAVFLQMKEERVLMKRLGWAAVGAVVLQALLGGLTVLLMLPPAVSIFHACLAQTFFCILISITYFLSPGHAVPVAFRDEAQQRKIFRIAKITVGLIFAQLILGATVRHTSRGHVVFLHMFMAAAVVAHVLMLSGRILYGGIFDRALTRAAVALGTLTLIQIFLGLGSYIYTYLTAQGYTPALAQVMVTAAHQTTGALILGTAFFMTLKARK